MGWSDDIIGWLSDHADSVVAGIVALLVASMGVIAAEGGISRRKLKRMKEELEVLALFREQDFGTHAVKRLEGQINERLGRYVLTRAQRLMGRLINLIVIAFFAGVMFYFYDREWSGGEPTRFTQEVSQFGKTVGFWIRVVVYIGLAVAAVGFVASIVIDIRKARRDGTDSVDEDVGVEEVNDQPGDSTEVDRLDDDRRRDERHDATGPDWS